MARRQVKKASRKTTKDNRRTAFPASAKTPGQAASRSAFDRFQQKIGECEWASEYLELRSEGWTWRLAALIAWLASPADRRWPPNQQELATQVLGLRSDRVIRKWRDKNARIDERVGELQVAPLLRHRRDVINALVKVAATPEAGAHSDRKLYLEMTGDYKPRGGPVAIGAGTINAFDVLAGLSDEQLDRLLANIEAAGGAVEAGEETPDG